MYLYALERAFKGFKQAQPIEGIMHLCTLFIVRLQRQHCILYINKIRHY